MRSVFISSTFKDMQSERDLLHEQIFPRLRKVMAEYGEDIRELDLRWGVDTANRTEESGLASGTDVSSQSAGTGVSSQPSGSVESGLLSGSGAGSGSAGIDVSSQPSGIDVSSLSSGEMPLSWSDVAVAALEEGPLADCLSKETLTAATAFPGGRYPAHREKLARIAAQWEERRLQRLLAACRSAILAKEA